MKSPSLDGTGAGRAGPSSTAHARDLQLAREALAGSSAARREFAERMACVPRYLAVMNSRLGRPLSDDALEDLAQETLVEIWRRLDSYAGLASLMTWAYRFCQQVLWSRLRSTRQRPRDLHIDAFSESVPERLNETDYEHVYRALEKVDSLGALAVQLKHFEQLTFEQLAPRMGVSTSSAKMHYQRALVRLREILGPMRKEAGI